jgi:HD-GYP domain-containing protein (c-di-GMP phosphodiesterase class II)
MNTPRPPSSSSTAHANPAQVQLMGKTLVGQLYMVLRTVRIHDSLNQTMLLATEHLKDTLNTVWSTLGSVKLEFIEDQVYLNDNRLRLDTQSADNVKELGSEFRARGLGGLTFKRPVTTDGIRALVAVFMQVSAKDGDPAAAMREKLLELRDLAVEILGPRRFQEGAKPVEEVAIDPRLWALQTYAKAVLAVKRFAADAARDGPSPDGGDPRLKLTRIAQDLVDIASERANLLIKVCSIKDCTDYVYNHAVNVGVLSIAMGRALGMSRTNLVDLGLSGMFADLGFTQGLMDTLDKPQLDEKDKDLISQHTVKAVRLLLGRGALTRGSMRRIITAFQHHVHFDLKGGYPDHEKHRPLHVFARIVAIADSYDALTTNRPWREAFAPAEALKIMAEDAGKKFDPALVKVLINLLGIYPLGTRVKLNTGELAVVYHASADAESFDRPIVKVTQDAQGQPVTRTLLRDLDERGPDGKPRYSLVGAQSDLPGAA